MNRFLFLFLVLFIGACSAHDPNTNRITYKDDAAGVTNKKVTDTTYMYTGFYFLAEDGKGINKRVERSDKVYTLSPSPFASVKNIQKAEIVKTHLKNADYTELRITYDRKGTEDLAAGTGHFLHPQIALVIANRLLYVAQSQESITTGVVNIIVDDYSPNEIEQMRDAINKKK